MIDTTDKSMGTKPFSSTGPHGHRSRMRGRLLISEAALADYEILEMLLFLGIPRKDTKPLAKGLINTFGSLAGAIQADRAALVAAGVPESAIAPFAMVVEAAGILAKPEAIRRKVIADLTALERHLDVPERTAQPPGLSALLLNNRNQLLGEPSWDAEIKTADLARELLRHALDQHATATILVRNARPCGGQDQCRGPRAAHGAAPRRDEALGGRARPRRAGTG